jgi:hypothetical protein
MAESSTEGYGSKSAVLSVSMMMMMMMNIIYYDRLSNLELHYKEWSMIKTSLETIQTVSMND